MTKKNIQYCSLRNSAGFTTSWAQGGRWRCRPRDGVSQCHRGLGNGAGCIASRARGGQHFCGLGNGIAGLGTAPTWLMASLTRFEDDGGA
jgi:hypothetical protein